jgi:8-oxo-dGTP pyrophosphatase MutT (NUDIX family)
MNSGVERRHEGSPVAARALIAAYAARAPSAEQAETARRMLAFIDAHPDCLWRTCLEGHLTGSAWVIDRARRKTLLTHHRKLGKWLQLGGHADGEEDLAAVALREAREESGLADVRLASPEIYDLDAHAIPARGSEPAHIHYDVRFLCEASSEAPLQVSDESHALAWLELDAVVQLNPEESLLRMVRRTPPAGST